MGRRTDQCLRILQRIRVYRTVREPASLDIGRRILEKAIVGLGGCDEAAARLNVSATLLKRCLDGWLVVPDSLLLRAMDLLSRQLPERDR